MADKRVNENESTKLGKATAARITTISHKQAHATRLITLKVEEAEEGDCNSGCGRIKIGRLGMWHVEKAQ
jgi:hypothetical protein